jgi:hypothetical protein
MENALPGAGAVKEERDVEEVTQKLKTESEEESLAALPAFPVPVADQHNDTPKRSLRQQAEEAMKLFEFVHHSVGEDQVRVGLAGDAPYQHSNMRPNQGNLPEVLNALEENLNKAQDLLEANRLLPAPYQEKPATDKETLFKTVKRTASFAVNNPLAPDGPSSCVNITNQQSFEDLLSDISQLETIGELLASVHE